MTSISSISSAAASIDHAALAQQAAELPAGGDTFAPSQPLGPHDNAGPNQHSPSSIDAGSPSSVNADGSPRLDDADRPLGSVGDSLESIIGDCTPTPKDKEIYIDDNGRIGWRTVVHGTSDDDTINVTRNPDGTADVTVNGETTHYSAEDAKTMRVDGGAGNDTITVQDNRPDFWVELGGGVVVDGGSGDDNISGDLDRVDANGGTGRDTINGLPEFDLKWPR